MWVVQIVAAAESSLSILLCLCKGTFRYGK